MHSPNSLQPLPRVPVGSAVHFQQLSFGRVEPDREQIYRLVGLRPGRANHERWFELVEQLIAETPRIVRARGMFRVDEVVSLEARRVALRPGITYEGGVGAFLKHSQYVATFIVTIGSALERLSRRWMRDGKLMQGTIADAIASESAEACAARLQEAVERWAVDNGLGITPRYSPGYCGMHVSQQRAVFAAMPARQINVRLKPSCLMLPMKSISGLIGIGPADLVEPTAYPCELCTQEDCMQRRAPFNRERFHATESEDH